MAQPRPAGGDANSGVVYRITPAGAYNVMVVFDGTHAKLSGYEADAGLIAGADGVLYGATVWGGTYGCGVLFSMTTDGTYSVLHSFYCSLGTGAYATPMQHTNGRIYGTTTRGGVGGKGVIYSLADGLASFLELTSTQGVVGKSVGILGRGFSTATSVTFNETPASFHVVSNTFMTATVPSGETGYVRVNATSGNLTSGKIFRVVPQITGFSPETGNAGDTVTITGTGLIQTEAISVGGVKSTAYTVNSDSKLTFQIPTGVKTGKVLVTTPGGAAASTATFTVTP
ncbi:MAG TPA: choice-of-anchor tandem repeat GloVer-containing protein [Candidatus Sulfotelmatobacter sp.]|jgi:uncharacterized repeat protein (TIGR03803 family)|nr:choice-of-anchor tandem repeat GloVer-containing protein [Candidatus Sulfotelmatobacter sp.]